MKLNTLKPAPGSKKKAKRLGRGIGSTLGKTCGRGHKGQKARAGGFHKVGFEGGQMPLQRRLPKFGFTSRMSRDQAEVRLSELEKLDQEVIDLKVLIEANVVAERIKRVKVIASGKLTRRIKVEGLLVTAGARKIIEVAGGMVN